MAPVRRGARGEHDAPHAGLGGGDEEILRAHDIDRVRRRRIPLGIGQEGEVDQNLDAVRSEKIGDPGITNVAAAPDDTRQVGRRGDVDPDHAMPGVGGEPGREQASEIARDAGDGEGRHAAPPLAARYQATVSATPWRVPMRGCQPSRSLAFLVA